MNKNLTNAGKGRPKGSKNKLPSSDIIERVLAETEDDMLKTIKSMFAGEFGRQGKIKAVELLGKYFLPKCKNIQFQDNTPPELSQDEVHARLLSVENGPQIMSLMSGKSVEHWEAEKERLIGGGRYPKS